VDPTEPAQAEPSMENAKPGLSREPAQAEAQAPALEPPDDARKADETLREED